MKYAIKLILICILTAFLVGCGEKEKIRKLFNKAVMFRIKNLNCYLEILE